jgi:cellulose synthase/poly-beta-1,6-N-acetylglucosamine synthase-like glycosyltransferase
MLLRSDHRGGKEHAQLKALERASGDVIIFSDVCTELDTSGVSRIASNFADPTVGCVSSRIMTTSPDGRTSGEGTYLRYEMFLRRLECRVNSIIGLSGSFFAVRANVCADLRHDTDSDFQALLSAVRMGYRGVFDPDSCGYYQDIAAPQKEFNRRIRTVLRGMTTLLANLDLLNPLRYPLFAFQLITHKLLRWLMPLFLLGILVSTLALSLDSQIFRVLAGIEVGGCLLGLLAVASAKIASFSPMHLFRYAVLTNLGILFAWLKFLRGERIMFWEPSKR